MTRLKEKNAPPVRLNLLAAQVFQGKWRMAEGPGKSASAIVVS
jgi:hypothetical protein